MCRTGEETVPPPAGTSRRVRVMTPAILLLLLGHVAAAAALPGPGPGPGPGLDCTNDFEQMVTCQLELEDCSGCSLTLLVNHGPDQKTVSCQQCGSGLCCCSVQTLCISGERHTATVWKDGRKVGSTTIDISDSVKPKTPTIVSVKETNGKFGVMWDPNMKGFVRDSLIAAVTYRKKGDAVKVSKSFRPATVKGLHYYEIPGGALEPNTTYMVSVRSQSSWSDRFSNSSEEWEFSTPAPPASLLLAVLITLSIAAVIFSGAIYCCYVKLKTKWWDAFPKYPNPNLLNMNASEPKVLKSAPAIISSVCIEPLILDDSKPWSKMSLTDTSSGSLQQSSGISTGSSCLSYANTKPADIKAIVQDALCKALPSISLMSPLPTSAFTNFKKDGSLFSAPFNLGGVRADDTNSGSSYFDNKTYSILIPSQQQKIMADTSEVQMQAEMPCDSAYHPNESDAVNCPELKVPACLFPAQLDVIVPTDMSYQQCNADSGTFSCAEDSSLSSISSGTNTTTSCDLVSRVEPGCERSNDVVSGATKLNAKSEEAAMCDKDPCDSCVPAEAFHNLAGLPDVLLSEQRSGELEEHLDKFEEEPFTKIPESFLSPVVPAFMNNAQSGQCLSELHTPFLCLMSADRSTPVITDSGYQSV